MKHAFYDGIDRLEMAWIAGELDLQLLADFSFARANGTLMIFHIALVSRKVGMRGSFKNCEDTLRHIALFRIADDV